MAAVVINGDVSGSVTLQAPSAAGSTTLTLPSTSGTVLTTASTTGISGSAISSGTVAEAYGGTGTNTGYYGFKNRIINGAVGISQRTTVNSAVAVSNAAAGTFGPDRWWGYTGTLSLWNIYQVTTGNYDFPYAVRTQRIAGQTSTSAIYCGQTIEANNCTDLAGQSVTLSFYATAGANYSGGAATVQVLTGTAADQGTLSLNSATWTGLSVPINSTFTPTTTRTKFTFTGTIGSTVQEIAFRFNWSGSGTAGANDYIDITGVQLEKGSTATSFDYRPYGTELSLCQRYYEKSYDVGTAPGTITQSGARSASNAAAFVNAATTRNFSINATFAVTKRTTPNTVTIYDPSASNASGKISGYSSATQYTVSSIATSGTTNLCQYITTSSSPSQTEMSQFHFTVDAEL